MTPIVLTYHEDIGRGGNPLVELWKKAWKAQGYIPIVLGLDEAKQHQKFKEYDAVFQSFPTVNPPAYELSCYRRWLAYSVFTESIATHGCCLTADTDCLAYGKQAFEPKLFECLEVHVPSLCIVSRIGLEWWIRRMVNHGMSCLDKVNDRPHVSDMIIMAHTLAAPENIIEHRKLVLQHGEPGWDKADYVHFSGASIGQTVDKEQFIQKVRPV